jgi:uncharacterized protein YyaL (SSP411 family)
MAGVAALLSLALGCDAKGQRRHARPALPSAEEIPMLPPDGGIEFNRLIHETSPYLLQHARNPVDWYPWGDEAFDRAKREDKPVFLSIGYSSCHWCHVMERESFENEEIARLLNEGFVSIKVDREERPDVDEVYMTAVQLMTGRGGWPLSVFLTPDRKPFFGGTYFPPEDVNGRAGFRTLVASAAEAYRTRRHEIEAFAGEVVDGVRGHHARPKAPADVELDREPVRRALAALEATFDERFGGFGGAPKFPPHGALRLLLEEYRRTKKPRLLEMATRTLDAMAAGGIRDHLGGGFHRYSTDAHWLVPHFEKMLYDNAQLARAYAEAHLTTGNEDYRRTAVEICDWVLHEMTGAEGGFHSALDADTEGEEGRFYVWRRDEIIDVLGEKEGSLFARAYGVEEGGNFRDEATGRHRGANILHLPEAESDVASELGLDPDELARRLEGARRKLLEARARRVRPGLDDKVLASWNGLMIGSLAYCGHRLGEPRYVAAAERAAQFIIRRMTRGGRLLRTYRDGAARLNAYLDDYAFLAEGLLDLHEAMENDDWFREARRLADAMIERFLDKEGGGFFFTSYDHEELLARPKEGLDKAVPAGNGVAAAVLLRLARKTGEGKYAEAARASLGPFADAMRRAPTGTSSLLVALSHHLDAAADARAVSGPVVAEAFLSSLRVAPGGEVDLALRLTIEDGWHVNSNAPGAGYLVATSVGMGQGGPVKLKETTYAQGRKAMLGLSSEPIPVYEGTVWIRSGIVASAGAEPGRARVVVTIRAQACNDRECIAPATLRLPVGLEIVDGQGPRDQRHPEVFRLLEGRQGHSS